MNMNITNEIIFLLDYVDCIFDECLIILIEIDIYIMITVFYIKLL